MRVFMCLIFAASVLFLAPTKPADASAVLWYNGDPRTDTGGTANEVASNFVGAINVYENFTVTDLAGWTIDRVWSINAVQISGVTQASWSIRSGSAVGNGGAVIAGGISSATQTPTGNTNVAFSYPEYTIEVSGLSVYLAPGTYWLSVSPLVGEDFGGVLKSYVTMTQGVNAIGVPPGNDGISLIDSAYLGYDFGAAFDADYSMGVAGVIGAARAVPEPSTFAMSSMAIVIGLGIAWRERRALR